MTSPDPKAITQPGFSFRKIRPVYYLIIACLFLLIASLFTYADYRSSILPRVRVLGISLGGQSRIEAERRISERVEILKNIEIPLTYEGQEGLVTLHKTSFSVNVTELVDAAYAHGRTGTLLSRITQTADGIVKGKEISANPSFNQVSLIKALNDSFNNQIETTYKETAIIFEGGSAQIVPRTSGQAISTEEFIDAVKEWIVSQENQPIQIQTKETKALVSVENAEAARTQSERFAGTDLKLTNGDKEFLIPAATLRSWLKYEVETQNQVSALSVNIDRQKIIEWIAETKKTSDKKPVNALLGLKDGLVVVTEPAQAGRTLGIDGSYSLLQNYLRQGDTLPLRLPTEVKEAEVRSENLAELGLVELVGTATTDFTGSPPNRKFNIGVGTKALSGSLIKAGDTYSTTTLLGPVEESTGYLPELVIKDNRTVPEAGGGLCQVSTTLFRAVLNAGLTIVSRTNHAYRVGYYEREVGPGLDATVYIPNPDFKWKNSMLTNVYIQAFVKGNTVTFEIFGKKDGRKATVSKPVIAETIPVGAPIYVETDTMYKGETKQIETAHDGARTVVEYAVQKDGETINTQTFRSYYKPWPAQYLVGTKDR